MNDDKLTYRQLSAKLDDVLLQLQEPDIDVDQALKLYEEGLQLAKKCEARLKQAENKLAKLAPQAKLV
jgi:exodeoxyribonuclease VII small subunit